MQTELQLPAAKKRSVQPSSGRRAWPGEIPEQVQALRAALESAGGPVDAAFLAGRFTRANADRVAALLETLVIFGQARKLPDGRYSGRV